MRRRTVITRLALALVLSLSALTLACDSYIRESAKTAHRSALGLQATRDTNQAFLRTGKITPERADSITRKLQTAVPIVRQFNEAVAVWEARERAAEDKEDKKAVNAEAQKALTSDEMASRNAVSGVQDEIAKVENADARNGLSNALKGGDK